jgi:hypothetical protein
MRYEWPCSRQFPTEGGKVGSSPLHCLRPAGISGFWVVVVGITAGFSGRLALPRTALKWGLGYWRISMRLTIPSFRVLQVDTFGGAHIHTCDMPPRCPQKYLGHGPVDVGFWLLMWPLEAFSIHLLAGL